MEISAPNNKPLHPAKVPKPKKPETITPTDNPKDSFKGKAIWRSASAVLNGEQIFEEIFRRVQLSLADTLSEYFAELEGNGDKHVTDDWTTLYKNKLNLEDFDDAEPTGRKDPKVMSKKQLFEKPDDEFEEQLKDSGLSFRHRIILRAERNSIRAGVTKNGPASRRR
jgi:hypothetical protein